MIEELPIIISVNSELAAKLSNINSICNKLSAQFNFQTLTANWYGDEDNILTIHLALNSPSSYSKQLEGLVNNSNDKSSIKHLSDDVFFIYSDIELQLQCYIAMTTSELELLELKPKLLAGLIQVKLHKVLNLIAEEQSLIPI